MYYFLCLLMRDQQVLYADEIYLMFMFMMSGFIKLLIEGFVGYSDGLY